MRKIAIVLANVLICVSLIACKTNDIVEIEHIEEKMIEKFWTSGEIYNEPVMMVASSEGNLASGSLAFVPNGSVVITDHLTSTKYIEGTDFSISGRLITRKVNSAMPYLDEEVLYGQNMPSGQGLSTQPASATAVANGKKTVLYTESSFLVRNQILVSYSFDKSQYSDYTPSDMSSKLANTLDILNQKKLLNVVVYGDSISTGCNSTGGGLQSPYGETAPDVYMPYNIAPFTPTWPELVANKLNRKFGSEINLISAARGGENSQWGKNNALTRAYNPSFGADPDVVFVGFGMNDGSQNISVTDFTNNIKYIINDIKNASSKTVEFVLIGSIQCNKEAIQYGIQNKYFAALQQISNDIEGVACVDIGSMHEYFLQNKRYIDMTANGINHPNDFMIRMYATNILTILGL